MRSPPNPSRDGTKQAKAVEEESEGVREVVESKIYRKTQRKKEFVESTPPMPFDTTGIIKLNEATVIDKRKQEQESVPSLYGIKPNPFDIVYQDPERPLPIEQLITKIPGFQSRPTAEGVPVISTTRRGGGPFLWVVDGQIINTKSTQFDGPIAITADDPYLSPLTFLNPLDILRIEFLVEAGQTSIFGVQAPAGVLLIYTRNGSELDYVNRKDGGLNFKGYEPAPDFETYMAEREKDRKAQKTELPTLYWNPSLETDKNGEAVIRFKKPRRF